MKQLHIVRHAKSSWDNPLSDIERPLAQRGITDANNVSLHLKAIIETPQALFVSPLQRTKQTAAIFVENLGWKNLPHHIEYDLYDFSGEQLITCIEELDDALDNVMIFGHNNAVTYFANQYTNNYFENIPTCGYLHIEFSISHWKDLRKGVLLQHIFPKSLR